MRALPPATLLALVLLAPSGALAQEVSAPLVYVVMEDRFEDGCWPEVAGACAANVTTDGTAGNTEVDAHHELRYVGVATDLEPIEDALGASAPTQSAGVDLAAFYAPFPVFALADEPLEEAPWPDERYRLDVAEEGVFLRYHAPAAADPTAPATNQTFTMMTFSERRGFDYDGLRLMNVPGPWVSDRELDHLHLCSQREYREAFGGDACRERARAMAARLKALTPSLLLGLHFREAELATDPSHLRRGLSADGLAFDATALRARPEAGGALPVPGGRTPQDEPRAAPPAPAAGGPAGRAPTPPEPQAPAMAHLAALHATLPAPTVWLRVAAAAAFGLLLALAAMGLYSRFQSRHELLASPVRQRLWRLVHEEPGIGMSAAARRLGLSLNGADHHARLLARAGVLAMRAERHRVFLYPPGREPSTPPGSAFLRRPLESDPVLRLLLEAPAGLTRAELRERLPDVPERTRNHRVRRLVSLGIVEERASGDGGGRLHVAGAEPQAA